LSWEYWNGQDWSKFSVDDGTENFTRSGLIQFLLPTDFQPKTEFEQSARYWIRVQIEGDLPHEPRIQSLALNTTWATQTVTLRNEILGSSDGTENQKLRTTQSPILNGQHLQVREPERPSVEEQNRIKQAEGDDAISLTLDATGRPQEIWVRWHEVSDFYGSQPRDRHYVIDRLTGEIQFGNGINGLIPPAGSGNLRMARYQTGGGVVGNKPAGSIVQLKTTVPYVDKVTNVEAAAGGADAEDLTLLRDRAPRTLRHNNRATTLDDYEDLAMLATPEVARAKCVPLRNLLVDALDEQPTVAGEVSVIIVPRSNDAKPLPSIELINRVQSYLKTYSVATANITVVGALYISVNVTVEIALTSLEKASIVEQAVAQKLARFLHPITGGFDGTGWAFGRTPHNSDFYALIEPIPGVDYIRTLDVPEDQEDQEYRNQVKKTGRFLVYSGNHKITFV
jgi:predicted phage baseplate assembly protein